MRSVPSGRDKYFHFHNSVLSGRGVLCAGWRRQRRWRDGRRPDGALQEGEGVAEQRVRRPGIRRCYFERRGRRPGRRRWRWCVLFRKAARVRAPSREVVLLPGGIRIGGTARVQVSPSR